MPYQSVGGAATGALLDALAERERSKQQALQNRRLLMQDQLARDKEAREAQYQRDEIANRQQQLAQDEAKAKAGEERAKSNDFRSHLDNSYIGGDIITDAGTAAEALQYTPDRIQVKQDPGAVGPVPERQMPVGSAIRILPNAAERRIAQAKAEAQQADQVLAQKYGGPEGLVRARANPLETELDYQAAHKTVPVSLLAEPKPTSKTLNVRDPDTGKVISTEQVPVGTEDHFLTRVPAGPQAPNPAPQELFDPQTKESLGFFQAIGGQWVPVKGGPVGGASKVKPTAQESQRTDTAQAIQHNLPTIRQQIDEADKRGFLGPISGRMADFLAGTVGSTELLGRPTTKEDDRLLGALREHMTTLATAMGQIHTRFGGSAASARFDKGFQTGKLSPDMIRGALDTAEDWANTYAPKTAAPKQPGAAGMIGPATKSVKLPSGKTVSVGDTVKLKNGASVVVKDIANGQIVY